MATRMFGFHKFKFEKGQTGGTDTKKDTRNPED